MEKLILSSSVVSIDWLKEHFDHPSLIILDASIPKVGQDPSEIKGGPRIKGSRFMDLKGVFLDKKSTLPNTVPSSDDFEIGARDLGINNSSIIVVYDVHGIYSSPRAWWLFKLMGHEQVAVLDGGLPAWESKGFPTEDPLKYDGPKGDFTSDFNPKLLINYKDVLKNLGSDNIQIIDARSSGRFDATAPEPRAELRGGHIPGSSNLPIKELIVDGHISSKEVLNEKLDEAKANEKELIFTCGSGITACVLAFAAEVAGKKNISVYDGSWTEWGGRKELPIEK